MTSIRLVVSDVDGTLLNPDKQLTPAAIAAVHRLHAHGVAFTAVSSRPPFGMRMLMAPLKLMLPLGAFNGSMMFEPGGATLENHAIPHDAVNVAIELLTARGIDVWLFTTERWIIRRSDGPYVERERRAIAFEPDVVDAGAPLPENICKVVGVSDDFELLAACEPEMKAALGKAAHVTRSQNYYLDVTAPGVDKGTFVEAIASRLEIPLKDVATIGDMVNDLPMFLKSGVSFAMGNAGDAVKSRTTYTTASNAEDGFAKAMDRILELA